MSDITFNLLQPDTFLWIDQNHLEEPDYQVYTCALHSITKEQFVAGVNQFSNPALPPKAFTTEEVAEVVNGVSADSFVTLTCDDKEETNDDIQLVQGESAEGGTIYSAAYFKGLVRLFPDASFEFFKASVEKNASFVFDIIFRVVSGGYVIYYGDLSELYPLGHNPKRSKK
jgi:hypothetical protein